MMQVIDSPHREVHPARGIKRLHLMAPEHGENINIVASGTTLGRAIPPKKLFKGKICPPERSHDIPPGSAIEMTVKWSTTCHVLAKWISQFAEFRTAGKHNWPLTAPNLVSMPIL
jgi:hypothetical protein